MAYVTDLINQQNSRYRTNGNGNPTYLENKLIYETSTNSNVGIGFDGTGLEPSSKLHIYDKDGNAIGSRLQNKLSPDQHVETKLDNSGNTTIEATGTISMSTLNGFVLPKVTTTQRNAITNLTAGLMVYDTTLDSIMLYTNAWQQI